LKGLFAKMKGATLPLTMTFCRVPEDQVWTAEANSNSPRHGQTPTTLPETDTDQTPYACAPDAGRKGQGGKGGRGRQTSRDALGGFGMPPKGAGVHLGGSSGGMKNHARVQSESQTMPVLAALVAEVAKSRHQRRGHVRGNTAPDVISKLHHVAPEPRKEPPPVSMKEQVELRPWYSGKGLSVIYFFGFGVRSPPPPPQTAAHDHDRPQTTADRRQTTQAAAHSTCHSPLGEPGGRAGTRRGSAERGGNTM
jgi:hypothetical protein